MKHAGAAAVLILTLASCGSFDTDTPKTDATDAGAGAGPDASTGTTDAGPTTPTEGLIGYWNFDEGSGPVAKDSSNHQNDGLITLGAWAEGVSGTAIKSTGPDRVHMASLDGVKLPPSGTLSFWFNADSFEGISILDVFENRSAVVISVVAKDADGDDRVQVQLTKHQPLKAGPTTEFFAIAPIHVNEWHHLVVVWDVNARHAYAYFDDTSIGDKGLSADWRSTEGAFKLFEPGCCDKAFRGRLDEMRLYNRALAPSEITSLR